MAEPQPYTVQIDDLVRPVSIADALQTWRGYVKTHEGEQALPAPPAAFINGPEHHRHLQNVHTDVQPIRDLGLYFLPDALVSSHCFVFAGDLFVLDGSTPNRIALRYAEEEGYLGAANRRGHTLLEMDQPGLVVAGPGYSVWGHWLLDFLPRLALAQDVLGERFDDFKIPIPAGTPDWVFRFVYFFRRISKENFFTYESSCQAVSCRNGICMPTYVHDNYFLHSYFKKIYSLRTKSTATDFPKRICIARSRLDERSKGPVRIFDQQEYFEQAAEKSGFVLIRPEELDFQAQVDLFSGAEAIVGEYGSGMHNALFSPAGTVIGQFVMPNSIQSRIAGLCGHRLLYLIPDLHPEFNKPSPWRMAVSTEAIDEFFAAMGHALANPGEPLASSGGFSNVSAPGGAPMKRSEVLQPILELFEAPSYLEIGVNTGDTFFALRAARKVAVDPHFLFDLEEARRREPHSSFFDVASDEYFGELIDPAEKFDVVYLDGLHTFEQTLRDFCNATQFLRVGGIIVVDDVVPNSHAASLPDEALAVRLKRELNDADQSWMGDVYRLVYFIDTFFQQYDFATVIENHGQLVVWRRQRSAAEVTPRLVEQIARVPFEAVLTERRVFRRRSYAEIMEVLQHRPRALTHAGGPS